MCLYVSAINDISYYVQIHCNTHWFFYWNNAISNGSIQYSYILIGNLLLNPLYAAVLTYCCTYVSTSIRQYVIDVMPLYHYKSNPYYFFLFCIHPNNLWFLINVCLRAGRPTGWQTNRPAGWCADRPTCWQASVCAAIRTNGQVCPLTSLPSVSILLLGRLSIGKRCSESRSDSYLPNPFTDGLLISPEISSKVSFELLKGFSVTPESLAVGLPLRSWEAYFYSILLETYCFIFHIALTFYTGGRTYTQQFGGSSAVAASLFQHTEDMFLLHVIHCRRNVIRQWHFVKFQSISRDCIAFAV